jgi:adenylate cyclase class 2
MAAIETEIKFRVADIAQLETKLTAVGFRLVTPRSFESNVLFDTPERRLRANREILRIRQYNGNWLLTHKRIPDSGVGEDRHKHRIETETMLSDGDSLAQVFSLVGFVPVFRYEKWRTEGANSGTTGHGHCVVDETPLGNFAELEGPPEWIDHVSQALGVDPADQMTLSYGRIFDLWKEQTGSTARDMTFTAIAGSN